MIHIDIFTFITKNSSDYAELLYRSMEKFKSGKHILHYKYIKSVNAERLPDNWDCVGNSRDCKQNSMNHAAAMYEALKYIDSKITIFVDADICVLYDGWDNVIVNALDYRQVFGTAYGAGLNYQNFPNVFFFCFRSKLLKSINLDFNPLIQKNSESPVRYQITRRDEEIAYCKKIGDIIKCDTGYKLPLIFSRAGIVADYMPRVLGSEKGSLLPYVNEENKKFCEQKPEHMAEWHYKGKLYLTHKQASRSHALNSEWGIAWKKRIDKFTNEKCGVTL